MFITLYSSVLPSNFFAYLPTGRCKEILPVAEAPGSRVLSAEEQRRLAEQEENTLRELRLFLRDVTKRLATDKRFNIFSKPVDIEEVWKNIGTQTLVSQLQFVKVGFKTLLKFNFCVSGVRLPGGYSAAYGPVHCHDQD